MKIEDFRNTTLVLTFGIRWPFDLLILKTIYFFLMTNSSMWWSFVKIGLKIVTWRQLTDRQTDRQTQTTTKSTHQYTWKFYDLASNKQTERGENITSYTYTIGGGSNKYKKLMILGDFNLLTSKAIGFNQWPNMQTLFKYQVQISNI